MNGLEEDYTGQITFQTFNAGDGADGETLFDQLGLRGHPAVLIYSSDGQEVFRQLGVISADDLEAVLMDELDTD